MANPFDIAEGKENPFDIAEKKMSAFDIAESQSESDSVVSAQQLKGTPVAPGMPTSVAELGSKEPGKGLMDVAVGIPETAIAIPSEIAKFSLEAITPFKMADTIIDNILFGRKDAPSALKEAQLFTKGLQEKIYTPRTQTAKAVSATPFLPAIIATGAAEKAVDVMAGEGSQTGEAIKQGIMSGLALLGGRSLLGKPKAITSNVAENIAKKTEAIKETSVGDIKAGSLAYGQPLPEKRMGVKLERIGGKEYDTQKTFLDLVDMHESAIRKAKEPVNFEQMTKEANALGYTIDDFVGKGKKAGVKDYAYQKAFADATTASVEALSNAKKKIEETQGSPESLAEFAIAMDQASLIVPKYFKAGTEQARGLVARRIAGNAESIRAKNYNKIIEAAGGPEKLKEISDKLMSIDLSNQYQVNKFIRESTKVKTADKIYWVWLNSILSGPPTHVGNLLSNTLTAMTKVPEKGVAASLDVLRSMIPKQQREVYFGEVPHEFFGSWQGIKEGVKAATKAWVDDMPQMGGKLETTPVPIKGKAGRIIGGPTRALMAADEFFKAIIYRSEINSLAFRQATKEGKKGKQKTDRVAELSNSPLDWMQNRAFDEAKYRTFQKELGPVGTQAMNLRNKSNILKVLFPFVKTPTNIVKFGLERTPMEFINAGIKVAKGDIKGGAISEQMAKPILGSLISGAFIASALEGNVSGAGPVNKNERDALYRTGWQPYSIKAGDKWYSYKRIEPMGMIVGLTSDAAEIWKYANAEEKTSLAAAISTAVGQNILNKTWMQGASNALNAITDPTRYGESWIQSVVGSTIPGIAAAAARAIDPNMRQAQDIIDSIKTRIPTLSEEVTPKLNLWGEPIKKSEGIGEYAIGRVPSRFVSPIQVSPVSESKIDKEIVRLIGTGYMTPIAPPSKTVGGIKLSPEQYQELQKRGGGLAKKVLQNIVESDAYKKAPDMAKTKIIESVIDEYRRFASAEMLGRISKEQGPEIVAQGAAKTKGIIPKNIEPSSKRNLKDYLLGIGGRQ